jgi:condensin complex subunit 1
LHGLITSFSLPEKIWYGAADKAISTIYALHPTPEIFATEIVKKSLSSVFGVSRMEDVSNRDQTQNDTFLPSVSPSKLGRFLFVVSHIALNHLVYIETSVRKIQKQKRKDDKSESTTDDIHADGSKSSEVILA